jgi:sigma-B regulation protein RsbU (phosphoserine phosphatase)
MDVSAFRRAGFGRGSDRRHAQSEPAVERRAESVDRRNEGFAWITLFQGADHAAIRDAIGACEVLVLPAGGVLLEPGESNDTVYLLLSGRMSAMLDSSLPAEAGIVILPGESIGELSAIDGKPVSARVSAVTEARVLALPRELFWRHLIAMPGVARNLLGELSRRMRRSNEVMLDAQRKRLELEFLRQELDTARQLQASMLPLRRPLFPERDDLHFAATMEPASAVGGDLFDAFFVDDNHLFFCIGDVSGHGIPAALFMARSIGLMRIAAMGAKRPDRVLQRINEQLCAGNDANMFITLFCGILDVATGRLVYTNGGHCAPLVAADGAASFLAIPKGALVGAIPGLRYTSREILLQEGATLVCFTDGVTEAYNEAGEEFSEERLLSLVAGRSGDTPEAMLDAIRAAVMAFTGHRALADDCTLLALRRPRKE